MNLSSRSPPLGLKFPTCTFATSLCESTLQILHVLVKLARWKAVKSRAVPWWAAQT